MSYSGLLDGEKAEHHSLLSPPDELQVSSDHTADEARSGDDRYGKKGAMFGGIQLR